MSIAVPKQIYECPHCLRPYRRKRERDLHIGVCELFSQNKTERSIELDRCQDTMTPEQMTDMIKVLISQQAKMKTQIDTLQRQVATMKQKVDVIDHLNNLKQKPSDFDEWVSEISIDEEGFETLLTDGASVLADQVFMEITRQPDNVPIRTFTNSQSKVYCYRSEIWRRMEDSDWYDITSAFTRQVMNQLKIYSDSTEAEDIDSRAIRYHHNIQKVMKSIPKIRSTIIRTLLPKVKMSLSNVVTYEFTFT